MRLVCCGGLHTALVTQRGDELYTFGDGTWGALGHGTSNGELLPRRVDALVAARVAVLQVAAGGDERRAHTLVLTKGKGELYGWGSCPQCGVSAPARHDEGEAEAEAWGEDEAGVAPEGEDRAVRSPASNIDYSYFLILTRLYGWGPTHT